MPKNVHALLSSLKVLSPLVDLGDVHVTIIFITAVANNGNLAYSSHKLNTQSDFKAGA